MTTQTTAVPMKDRYQEIKPTLTERFGYQNPMAVPRMDKVILNMGIGDARDDRKMLERAQQEMARVALQRPVVTRAKRSVSNFKIRTGMPVGLKVTLRRQRMWAFLEKLVHVALPHVRDFRGIDPNAFDGRGNYNLGIREHLVFPELSYDEVDAVRGMDVAIVTTAGTDEEGRALLEGLGLPFRS